MRSGVARLFVDEARIHVRAGRGGDGCVSFRREKSVAKGGPDGGDGGDGGSVLLVADPELDTLLEFAGRHHWHAENGAPGQGRNCHGRNGKDLVVRVPPGTLVYDEATGVLLKDLVEHHKPVCLAEGGRGGHGNARFATATHQTPYEFERGEDGQERLLRLELKLVADVGLVGLPNAGKSTLLSRLTRARPKVAAYPFTTKEPMLGILELPGFRRLVIADIPGLVEGAHTGAGLGDTFLRHVERTRIVVHLVDICPPEGCPSPVEAHRIIRHELEQYSPILAQREEIVVANKVDLLDDPEAVREFERQIGRTVLAASGVTGEGLRELGEAAWRMVDLARRAAPVEATPRPVFKELDTGKKPVADPVKLRAAEPDVDRPDPEQEVRNEP